MSFFMAVYLYDLSRDVKTFCHVTIDKDSLMTEEIHNRLMKARVDAGFRTAIDASRRFGWNEFTYRAHESGLRGVKQKTIKEYAKAYKVSEAWLATGNSVEMESVQIPITNFIPVKGLVAAGLWQDVGFTQEYTEEAIPMMPGLKHPPAFYYALKVQGTSMNRLFVEGEILVCLDIQSSGVEIFDGDIAIVERLREQEGLREVTAKRVRRKNGRIELWPESTDPKYQDPIIFTGESENTEIRIIARVEGGYRTF